jgi:hypothetical protein
MILIIKKFILLISLFTHLIDETIRKMATLGLLAETNIRPRAYQLEMLEESLKGNTIVAVSEAMDSKR